MNSVLDRTPPCPNVDVRLMHPSGMSPHAGMPAGPGPHGNNGNNGRNPSNMFPSFLDNPTSFLAQQAAFVNNSLNSSLSRRQDADNNSNQGETSLATTSCSSTHSSPIAQRLTPGRSPTARAVKSPPAIGRRSSPMSSPGAGSMPSPASQSTPVMRRASVSSHGNVSPCVTPHSAVKSPIGGLPGESPGAANDSSSSTLTAPSAGSSFNQSPNSSSGSLLTQSPPGVSPQKVRSSPAKLPASAPSPGCAKTSPRAAELRTLQHQMPPSAEQPKVLKSPKSRTRTSHAKNKTTTSTSASSTSAQQNQLNLSFSNALEFQLLASKYGTGNFPASNLLSAAAKAQGTTPNPLIEALAQLQQGLIQNNKGKNKGKAMSDNKQDPSGNARKDDFHASSFLVNESGQLEGSEALMAAVLSNPSLVSTSQAQMLLQQLSGTFTGQNSEADGTRMDPEQLAASQMAMLNMAASLMATSGSNQGPGNNSAGFPSNSKDAAPTVMTGLDVAHNAIVNAFNASNISDKLSEAAVTAGSKAPRSRRRKSAPQGQRSPGAHPQHPAGARTMVSPSTAAGPAGGKSARPRSAPGANAALPPSTPTSTMCSTETKPSPEIKPSADLNPSQSASQTTTVNTSAGQTSTPAGWCLSFLE